MNTNEKKSTVAEGTGDTLTAAHETRISTLEKLIPSINLYFGLKNAVDKNDTYIYYLKRNLNKCLSDIFLIKYKCDNEDVEKMLFYMGEIITTALVYIQDIETEYLELCEAGE